MVPDSQDTFPLRVVKFTLRWFYSVIINNPPQSLRDILDKFLILSYLTRNFGGYRSRVNLLELRCFLPSFMYCWGLNSHTQSLPSIYEALGSVHRTTGTRNGGDRLLSPDSISGGRKIRSLGLGAGEVGGVEKKEAY